MEESCTNLTRPSYAADLPPKVVEAILIALRDAHICTETRGQGFRSSWIPATWVCRRWREVALATPKLWSWIDITVRHCDPEMFHTLVERAGNEDLSISLDGQALDLAAMCELVHPFGNRIFHLSVVFEDSQAPVVEVLLQHLGPKLKVLQVYGSAPAIVHEVTFDPRTIPNMRSLSITNFFLRPTSVIHGLTDLTLETLWGVQGKQEPGEYFYELLAACPDLEELDMEDAMPGAYQVRNLSTPPKPVEFRKMRSLRVSELAIDLPTNLANIVIPTTASLSVTGRYDGCPPDWEDEDKVLPMDILPENKFENFPALADTRDLCMHFGTRCCVGDIHIQGSGFLYIIPSLEHADDKVNLIPEFAEHVFAGLPKLVIVANVAFLELHIAQQVPEYGQWPSLLAQFPNVHALTIGGRHTLNEVVIALRRRYSLLPKLEQLTVCVSAANRALTSPDARAFGAWLADRAVVGRKLESLIVNVPEDPLNTTTMHLASALIAYAAVRRARVRVVRQTCATCHGKHDHLH